MMMAAGLVGVAVAWMEGRKVEMPWMTPKRFVSRIFWK
jgi:hypothetical protein